MLWLIGCGPSAVGDTGTTTASTSASSGSSGDTATDSTGSTGSTGSAGSTGGATTTVTSGSGSTSGGSCATLVAPDQSAGCTCKAGHTCTANGCFGGYWCDTSGNRCVAPPAGCGTTTSTSTTATSTSGGGSTGSLPVCANRPADVTQISVEVRVDRYRGIITGPSGPHEDFDGTITRTFAVANASVVDTNNVSVAMNVASSTDPTGLPHEIRLTTGELVDLVGEYIPMSTASAHTSAGPAAVIHFTHSPCGSVAINGVTYQ